MCGLKSFLVIIAADVVFGQTTSTDSAGRGTTVAVATLIFMAVCGLMILAAVFSSHIEDKLTGFSKKRRLSVFVAPDEVDNQRVKDAYSRL